MSTTTVKKWTPKEVERFSEWDQKRKSGQLGTPMHFNNVKDLRAWLDSP